MSDKIEIARVKDLLIAQYNKDFNEKSFVEAGMSREDLRFLQIMEESIQLTENNYCTNLHFKIDNVQTILPLLSNVPRV